MEIEDLLNVLSETQITKLLECLNDLRTDNENDPAYYRLEDFIELVEQFPI